MTTARAMHLLVARSVYNLALAFQQNNRQTGANSQTAIVGRATLSGGYVNIHIDNNLDENRFKLVGELTIYTVGEVKASLLAPLKKAQDLEVDLSQVSNIDSAGIQILMLVKREAMKYGCNLRLLSHSNAVLKIFEVFNLAGYFGDPLFILTGDAEETAAARSSL